LGGSTENQGVIRKGLALRNQRTGADQAIAANHRTVHHNRLYADQRAVPDGAAVQHRLMANRDIRANRHRESRIGVQHRAILNVAVRTDGDEFVVPAQYRLRPDARTLA
jgi:hypothetical protein